MATEISALLDEGVARLKRVTDEPRREAEVLLGAALGRARAWLLAHPDERILDCEATDRYEAAVTRRALGEPVAYILGEKEFWSLPLAVGPGVLVPRPETELAVERALAHLPADADVRVLDLAAGSGAIALAIAAERPRSRVTATDVSDAAIDTTRANAARHGLAGRVEVLRGSWYEPVGDRAFELIVSNPPYISVDDPRVEPAVRRFEPPAALFAGPTGLEALHAIVQGAPRHLAPGGWLVLEHGDTQGSQVRQLLQQAGLEDVRTHRDLAGHERCSEGRKSSGRPGEFSAGAPTGRTGPRPRSRPQAAEHVVVPVARGVAAEAGGRRIGAHGPLGRAVADEPLEPPATRRGIAVRVLEHDAQHLARALDHRMIRAHRAEQVEHDHRSVGKAPLAITLQRLVVGVQVMQSAERIEQRVAGLDDHALHVRPVAVARRVRDRIRDGRRARSESRGQQTDEQCWQRPHFGVSCRDSLAARKRRDDTVRRTTA